MKQYVVWCETHKHYLKHVGATGTSWREDQREAQRYATKPAARKAVAAAAWLDHRPVVWAVPAEAAK